MLNSTSPSYNVVETIQSRLARISNDYSNAARLYQYGPDPERISLVDREGYSAQGFCRVRDAAQHAFLEYERQGRLGASILIPTKGQPDLLALTLESVSRQTLTRRHPKKLQVVIVEDGIAPMQKSVFEHIGIANALNDMSKIGVDAVRIRLRENKGRSIARNVALTAATNEIVFFIDNSMVLEPTFLVEHMMRHTKLKQAVALLGFKENISLDEFQRCRESIVAGERKPSLDGDIKEAHVLKGDEAPFEFNGKQYAVGDTIHYMQVANDLLAFEASSAIGSRTLPTFFQTNIVSARRTDLMLAGGFEPTIRLWGFEDSLLGARLVALADCKLIPCPSSRAFNLETVDSNPDSKMLDIKYNRSMYESQLGASADLTYEASLKNSVAGLGDLIERLPAIHVAAKRSDPDYDLEKATATAKRLVGDNGLSEVVVLRRDLIDLMASARAEARSSVTNLSGDLSWVAEELEAIRAVMRQNPTLRFQIFYDRNGIQATMIPILRELRDLGVEFRPYPQEIASTHIRCLLVDADDPSECRVVWMTRGESPKLGTARLDHQFIWHDAGPNSGLLVESIRSLVKVLEASPRIPVRVGICGVNNVGKSSFASQLSKLLSARRYITNVVDDVFRALPEQPNLQNNFSMLAMQLSAEASAVSCDVRIFDRTSIDNWSYLCLRHFGEGAKDHLASAVAASARTLDILIDVRWPNDTYDKPTKWVTAEDRCRVRKVMDDFLRSYGLKSETVLLNPEDLPKSIASEVERIGKVIDEYIARRWVRTH